MAAAPDGGRGGCFVPRTWEQVEQQPPSRDSCPHTAQSSTSPAAAVYYLCVICLEPANDTYLLCLLEELTSYFCCTAVSVYPLMKT